jgi:hypothetical protein
MGKPEVISRQELLTIRELSSRTFERRRNLPIPVEATIGSTRIALLVGTKANKVTAIRVAATIENARGSLEHESLDVDRGHQINLSPEPLPGKLT